MFLLLIQTKWIHVHYWMSPVFPYENSAGKATPRNNSDTPIGEARLLENAEGGSCTTEWIQL